MATNREKVIEDFKSKKIAAREMLNRLAALRGDLTPGLREADPNAPSSDEIPLALVRAHVTIQRLLRPLGGWLR